MRNKEKCVRCFRSNSTKFLCLKNYIMEAGKAMELLQNESSNEDGRVTFSDEINIVVFKDTSRQNLLKRRHRCCLSTNVNKSPLLYEKMKNGSDSRRISKGNRKKFPCNQCDYEGTKTNLAVHRLRTHNKEYKCSKCEYQSVTEGGVERHERIFHSTEDVRAYACGVCSYRGVTRKQLHEHTKFQHREGVAKHPCPACQKMFKTQVQLKHHIISHSLERLYSCKGCSYRAKHRQSLHFHIQHTHPGCDARTLFQGPTDSDFEALIQSASSAKDPQWTSKECLKLDFSLNIENDSKSGDEEQLPTTSLLGGGGVDNLLIFPLGNVMSLCKDAGANEIVAKSSADGSPINSPCDDASFNQILMHLLGTK